jgi:LuxR family quorum sensing-dependent transcriptional regulator
MMALAVDDRCRNAAEFWEQSFQPAHLTRREMQCMQWVAAGKTDKQIAGLIGISPVTAHFHIEQAKKKLRTPTRTEAIALLTGRGLL